MRKSVALFTLLRITFWTANEKKDIFGWSQSPSFNNLKKNVGALGTRMDKYQQSQLSGHARVQAKRILLLTPGNKRNVKEGWWKSNFVQRYLLWCKIVQHGGFNNAGRCCIRLNVNSCYRSNFHIFTFISSALRRHYECSAAVWSSVADTSSHLVTSNERSSFHQWNCVVIVCSVIILTREGINVVDFRRRLGFRSRHFEPNTNANWTIARWFLNCR